mmetsp:Transcript_7096/g.20947  ORF Transcript_7096/g.20947 Transcript_7096/m.20947 type:complete len:354 (-) Transcript_7096:25-1086(-)
MPYPGDYGWICQTWQSETRKPVEILIINTFGLEAETLTDVRVIGVMERSYRTPRKDGGNSEVTDFKVIGVGANDPRMNSVRSLSDLNQQNLLHYSNFFTHTAEMANCSDCKIVKFMQAEEAMQKVHDAHKQYWAEFKDTALHNSPNLWCLPWEADATSGQACDRVYPAVVEASKHSHNIYSFDCHNGVLKHTAPLKTSTFWPGNYGFVPQTVAEDGKPVDVMILSNVPLRSGSVVEIRIVGAAECSDEMGPDIKMIAVPKNEPRMKEWKTLEDVPKHMKDEMVHFFNAYMDLEADWKFCKFDRWMDSDDAMRYIQTAHSRFFLFVMPMQRLEKRVTELEDANDRLRRAGQDAK